jgi:hypothetical protein
LYNELGMTAVPLGADGLPAKAACDVPARQFLCCVAERDMIELVPKLSALGRRRFQNRPGAAGV